MHRRRFLHLATLAAITSPIFGRPAHAATATAEELKAMQDNWQTFHTGTDALVTVTPPLTRTAADWRKTLPQDAWRVLFEEDTERPGSSPLDREKRAGLFLCAACGLPLFTSAMKFDSGTGWPSFFTSIPGHLQSKTDYKLIWPRTEYHCAKCGGHQGHVFDDGPAPTGERWCNNGLALRFVPSAG